MQLWNLYTTFFAEHEADETWGFSVPVAVCATLEEAMALAETIARDTLTWRGEDDMGDYLWWSSKESTYVTLNGNDMHGTARWSIQPYTLGEKLSFMFGTEFAPTTH